MIKSLTYHFGSSFQLDTETQVLWYGCQKVDLQPKRYDLLLYFLKNAGQLLPREMIIQAVWPGLCVEDTSLRLAVSGLRNQLLEKCKTADYIQTVYKYGYRFTAKVTTRPDIDDFEDELDRLYKVFKQVNEGRRTVVLLKGASGVGKTAFIKVFLKSIGQREQETLRARCVPLGSEIAPFLSMLEALELRCQNKNYGQAIVDTMFKVAPTWLYQISTVLNTEVIGKLKSKITHISPGIMLREGADLFEFLGATQPFILILDNAQWADEFTLDLLNLLAYRSSATHLLIIISYRPGENSLVTQQLEKMQEELKLREVVQEVWLHKSEKASE